MDGKIRLLRADEIECRVSAVRENGLSLLLYKDARVDQRILDETFGAFGWKRSHQSIDGNLYCTVEVFDPDKRAWVSKQDVGTTGHAEKEKSQASDSFKRACFNWGIGRELYSAPFIWVPASDANIKRREERFFCNDHFSVGSIEYGEGREIVSLSVVNDSRRGKTVFSFSADGSGSVSASGKGQGISDGQLLLMERELERTGVRMDEVRERYGFAEPLGMSQEVYGRVMRALAKTKSGDVA